MLKERIIQDYQLKYPELEINDEENIKRLYNLWADAQIKLNKYILKDLKISEALYFLAQQLYYKIIIEEFNPKEVDAITNTFTILNNNFNFSQNIDSQTGIEIINKLIDLFLSNDDVGISNLINEYQITYKSC